jgi:hypothetical protein
MAPLFSPVLIPFLIVVNQLLANGQVTFGWNGGVNHTTLYNEEIKATDDRWNFGIGFRVGVNLEKSFGKVGVRIEADYSFIKVEGDFDDKVELQYISIPLVFFYKPFNKIRLMTGPEINILLNQKGPKYMLVAGEEKFNKVDFGALLQLEFKPIERFGVSIRNYFGLNYNGSIGFLKDESGLDRMNVLCISANYYLAPTVTRFRKLRE